MTSMRTRAKKNRDPTRMVQVGGLVVAAAGLVTQVISGVPGFPPVPPGPIILGAAAVFVTLAPWRWAPVVGLAASAFIAVGLALTPDFGGVVGRLGDPGALGPFAGTALFALGLAAAVVAGVAAGTRGFLRRS